MDPAVSERTRADDALSSAVVVDYDLAGSALAIARRGFAVFPLHTPRSDGSCTCANNECESVGKHPRTGHGVKDATKDPSKIEAWWRRHPDANIGLRVGGGYCVIDVDGQEGFDSLRTLERKLGALPETLRARTGGGGEHRFFLVPSDIAIPNRVGKLGERLDVRSGNGYVVAPPSLHASGQRYKWIEPSAPIAALPPQWLGALTSRASGGATAPADGQSPDHEFQLRPHVEVIRVARPGTNESLNRHGFIVGQLIAAGLADEAEAHAELLRAALQSGLPKVEARATLDRALLAGKTKPLSLSGFGGRPLTDLGNAERLVDRHGRSFRYVHSFGPFFIWDGARFRKDETLAIELLAKDTVRHIYAEATTVTDDEVRKAIARHARGSESMVRIKAMVRLAQSETVIAVRAGDLDTNRWKLNVVNGTVDLRTGTLLPHEPEDLITKLAPVKFDPSAKCPTFDSFLDRIMDGKTALIEFMQRAVGYMLTGLTEEQVLFFFYGTGANGKTTLLNTLLALFGDYGKQADPELLVAKRGEAHPTGVADLAGARLAVCVEVEQGKRLAEALLKQLTGGDRIKARFMHRDFFEFEPTHKLCLAANHKPVLRGMDRGLWRRIRLVPFNVTIPEDEQDKALAEKLSEELPGILAWAVRGCSEWQRVGLDPPVEVRAATEAYRDEMDTIGDFITDRCVLSANAQEETGKLRKAYERWCEDAGETPLGTRAFSQALEARGLEKGRAAKKRLRRGIRLIEEDIPF
jgi:putative DNA primase/helicase